MKLQQRKGQLAGWEAVIILVLIGYSAFMTYKWASKQTQTQVFNEGSKPYIPQIKTAPFSCVREGSLENSYSRN